MRNAYLAALYELAKVDKNVLALISDNGAIVYDKFRADFPNQYMNFGIAEANMIAAAAGMASRGKIPFAYTIGAFLAYRALEFIRNDVCYQRQNVKIVGTGAGFAYANLGATHHATEDISILRAMPNLTLFSPASPLEVKKVVQAAYKIDGPVYIRIGTNKEPEIYERDYDFTVGKAVTLRDGRDLTLMSTGSVAADVLKAADELTAVGYSVRVLNFPTIKPLDEEAIRQAAEETGYIVTVEEHSIYGGFGGAVAEVLAESGIGAKFRRVGLRDFAQGYGTHGEVAAANGLGARGIVKVVSKIL